MNYIEKHPMLAIIVGIVGISLSAIFAAFLFGEIPGML
jgi:hypothetical protein